MGMAVILVQIYINLDQIYKLSFPLFAGVCIRNFNEIGPVVLEEKSFENVDDGRTAEAIIL